MRTVSSFASMQFPCGSNCSSTKWRNARSANGTRAWQSLPIRPSAAMKLIAIVTLVVVAAAAAVGGTLALEEQAHDRELFAAYCMGVFGPDQSSLKSPSMPACLTNERGDECSERVAEIDQERQHVDLNLRQFQEALGGTRCHCARSLHDACQVPRRNIVLGRPMTMRAVSSGLPQDRVPPGSKPDSLERTRRRGALRSSRLWGGRALFFTQDSFRPLPHP